VIRDGLLDNELVIKLASVSTGELSRHLVPRGRGLAGSLLLGKTHLFNFRFEGSLVVSLSPVREASGPRALKNLAN
jgi:hypothetical protein